MDLGRKMTDSLLRKLEKRIQAEYTQAEKELREKMDDYFKRFRTKDAIKRSQLTRGVITEQEYKAWLTGQIAVGKQWQMMVDTVATDLQNRSKIAKSITNEYLPEVYSLSMNFATFDIEKKLKIDTSFTLYSREAVERILRDNPMLLPPPGKKMKNKISTGQAIKWRKGQIQSVVTQSIIQGESIPNMATRISNTLCVADRKVAIRYARTAATGAENAGRIDAFHRMQSLGIPVKKTWLAVLDGRTRHAHRELDGVTVPTDKPFHNSLGKIMYPGDPEASGSNIWNCRCMLVSDIEGFETDWTNLSLRHTSKLGDMSYAEWKKEHGVSQSILKPDNVAAIMKARYIADYRR